MLFMNWDLKVAWHICQMCWGSIKDIRYIPVNKCEIDNTMTNCNIVEFIVRKQRLIENIIIIIMIIIFVL